MNYDRALTQEQVRGTKTFHLPLAANQHPRVTVVVARDKNSGRFRAGFSVCSLTDNFSRRRGRNRAFERMCYAGNHRNSVVEATEQELLQHFEAIMASINLHHPGTIGGNLLSDLEEVTQDLSQSFDKMDSHRVETLDAAMLAKTWMLPQSNFEPGQRKS